MEKLDQLRQLAAYYRDLLSALSMQSGKHLVDIHKVLGYGLIADLNIFVSGYEIFLENETVKFTIDRMSPNAVANILKLADRSEEAGTEDQSEQETPTPEELARKATSARLIAIFRKQEQDPYNRETTVGFPVITGMYGKHRFCAPLFYYTVRISHDPLKSEIILIKDFEIPAFNFHLLAHLAGPDGDIDLVRQKVLPYLYREDFERKTIEDIVAIIGEEIDGFRGLVRDSAPAALLQDVLEARESGEVRLLNACIIVNARRSNAFLVDDLSQLAKLKELNGETVIETILADGPPENIEGPGGLDSSNQNRPLLFPFVSNKAQRRAARKADRARFMVIQGPPGTGKSLTIANIVCDLVAQGKTVLISSHQNKALEVIADKLPKIDYLAMSMLKGEKESVARLINQIENFSNYVTDVDLNISKQRLEENLLKIKEKEKTIQELQARFSELKNLERDRYRQQDNTCSYRRYHEIREYDQLDSEDEVPLGHERVVSDGLKEWFGLLQLLKNDLQDLDSIISTLTPNDPQRPMLISEIFEYLKEIIKIYEDTKILLERQESVSLIHGLLGKEKDLENVLVGVRDVNMWLNKHGSQMATTIEELKTFSIINISLSSTRQLARQLGKDVLQRISNISEQAKQLARELGASDLPHESFPLSPSHYNIGLGRDAFGVLSIAASTWWRWYLTPSARNAKRILSQEGFGTTTYKDRTNYLKQVGQWVSHWSMRRKISNMITHLREIGCPLPEQRHDSPIADLIKLANAIPHYTRLLEIQSAYPHTACSEELRNILNEKVNAISDTESCRHVQKTLEDAKYT